MRVKYILEDGETPERGARQHGSGQPTRYNPEVPLLMRAVYELVRH